MLFFNRRNRFALKACLYNIGVDFKGSPGANPQNRDTPMHLAVFTTFPPKVWVCLLNIFDKSTPVSSKKQILRVIQAGTKLVPRFTTPCWTILNVIE